MYARRNNVLIAGGPHHPEEPAMAAVYVEIRRDERTAAQWADLLAAALEGIEVGVVIEPEGNRAGVFLTARGSKHEALESAADRLTSDPHGFGIVDAARTQRASG